MLAVSSPVTLGAAGVTGLVVKVKVVSGPSGLIPSAATLTSIVWLPAKFSVAKVTESYATYPALSRLYSIPSAIPATVLAVSSPVTLGAAGTTGFTV